LFHSQITGEQLLKGDYFGLRDQTLIAFLSTAFFLEPLNLFFYTWRFFAVLEKEEDNSKLKLFYRWLALITIICFPATFYALFIGYLIEYGKYEEYTFKLDV